MRVRFYAALVVACGSLCQIPALAEENGKSADVLGLLEEHHGGGESVRQAVRQYLEQIGEIEQRAAQAKKDARAKLLDALGEQSSEPAKQSQQSTPGLIGAATIEGEPSGIAFHYEHGKLFPRELLWERFHQSSEGRIHFPNVTITLLGNVEVPQEMTVKVSHAAGGVNGDHGTLFVGDRQLGQVGDDTAKAEVYLLSLPAGVHPVRWVLTGGTFQNNLLQFEDPATGQVLRVFCDANQRRQTGAAEARENVEASADPSEWLKAVGPGYWRWVPVARP
jgi:hypothetical protein